MQRTTIAVPKPIRDRLKGYGRKGTSYAEIVERLMDAVDRGRFLADLDDGVRPAAPAVGASLRSEATLEAWSRMNASERLALGEAMRRQAASSNPTGTRKVLQSRKPKPPAR